MWRAVCGEMWDGGSSSEADIWKWQMLMSRRNIQGDATLLKPVRSMDDVWLWDAWHSVEYELSEKPRRERLLNRHPRA